MNMVLKRNEVRRKKSKRPESSLYDPRMALRLSQAEVDKLFVSFSEGNKESGHTLVLSVLPLCVKQIRVHNKHLFFRVGYDDVMHELFIHLLKCLPSYDPSRGKLTTWACWRTLDFYGRKLRKVAQIVKIPDKYLRDNPVGKAVFSGYTWDDYPELLYSKDPEPIESMENEELVEIVLLMANSPRERSLIKLRLEGETLKATGKTVGLSKERVRQILNRAYEKAKRYYDRLPQ